MCALHVNQKSIFCRRPNVIIHLSGKNMGMTAQVSSRIIPPSWVLAQMKHDIIPLDGCRRWHNLKHSILIYLSVIKNLMLNIRGKQYLSPYFALSTFQNQQVDSDFNYLRLFVPHTG